MLRVSQSNTTIYLPYLPLYKVLASLAMHISWLLLHRGHSEKEENGQYEEI